MTARTKARTTPAHFPFRVHRCWTVRAPMFAGMLFLAGCAGAPFNPAPYWEQRGELSLSKISIVVTDHLEAWCPTYPFAKACASRDYASGTCWVYMRPVYQDSAYMIDHEKCHCLGYDHDIPEFGFGNISAIPGVRSYLDVGPMGPKCPVDTTAMPHTTLDDRDPKAAVQPSGRRN